MGRVWKIELVCIIKKTVSSLLKNKRNKEKIKKYKSRSGWYTHYLEMRSLGNLIFSCLNLDSFIFSLSIFFILTLILPWF